MQPLQLSARGSDRATGYGLSAKLVRRDDRLFVGWLDAPEQVGGLAQIRLGVCETGSGQLLQTQTLGEGIDNHCGPALALDGGGRLHVLIGAHHGPFLYRWSDNPEDPASWSPAEPLGPADTYPSLVVDAEGTLHLIQRVKDRRWQLWYRRRRPGALQWEAPVVLAVSPTPGYNHFMQSFTVGPTGHLHALFQFHFSEDGQAAHCRGRAAVYLRSEDGGDSWIYDDGVQPELPVTFAAAKAICRYQPSGDLHTFRIGYHTVDRHDKLWFYCSVPDAPGVIYTNGPGGWERLDLAELTDGLDFSGGRSSSFSQGPDGDLHLLLACPPQGATPWYDPAMELYHLHLDGRGKRRGFKQLSETDPARANWLPALEPWDWARPEVCCRDGLFYAMTRGVNAGGIGGDNTNTVQTEVWLGKI
ncbi:MAG: hypothetical protein GKR89_24685 [Candidatus Latescibacteria bacterium]|nr:hypothetical protein [Candidatus Latescibacterota bacterium]